MQLMIKLIKCRMDSLVHRWKEINTVLVKNIFLFDDSLANDLSVMKVWWKYR